MPPDDLIALVDELGAPYGFERSVKIAPRQLLDDRCLISVHRSALGEQPLDRLTEICKAMAVPAAFAAEFPAALDGAEIVHFGHEGGASAAVRKVYFEYAATARRAMQAGDPVLVHLAYKWMPQHPDHAAVTHYRWLPCRGRQDIDARLRALLADAPRALRSALCLTSRVTPPTGPAPVMMMEVEEAGNPRRSCDLNVYDAALRLAEISDLIEATAADFAIPQSRVRAVFAHTADVALGHLSAGIGRDGQEFVTIYYGVEAH
jgi:tryptophan halogenase